MSDEDAAGVGSLEERAALEVCCLEREGVRIDVVDATETQVLRARVRKIVAREKKKGD